MVLKFEIKLTFQVSACLRFPGRLDSCTLATLSGSYPSLVRLSFALSTSLWQRWNACSESSAWFIRQVIGELGEGGKERKEGEKKERREGQIERR